MIPPPRFAKHGDGDTASPIGRREADMDGLFSQRMRASIVVGDGVVVPLQDGFGGRPGEL